MDAAELIQVLTFEERDELRSLNYLDEIGCLSPSKAERLHDLRLRYQQTGIGSSQEYFEDEQRVIVARAAPRFLGRRRR